MHLCAGKIVPSADLSRTSWNWVWLVRSHLTGTRWILLFETFTMFPSSTLQKANIKTRTQTHYGLHLRKYGSIKQVNFTLKTKQHDKNLRRKKGLIRSRYYNTEMNPIDLLVLLQFLNQGWETESFGHQYGFFDWIKRVFFDCIVGIFFQFWISSQRIWFRNAKTRGWFWTPGTGTAVRMVPMQL